MTLSDFFMKIEEAEDINGIAIGGGEFMVEHLPSGIVTALTPSAILGNNWDTIYEILAMKREPEPIFHMSRVVGYYSRVENWNESKVGELADRHKGNYSI